MKCLAKASQTRPKAIPGPLRKPHGLLSAVGAHGRARCSIALRAMTRLKFSCAIRLRNFRDLILIGGGHPSSHGDVQVKGVVLG